MSTIRPPILAVACSAPSCLAAPLPTTPTKTPPSDAPATMSTPYGPGDRSAQQQNASYQYDPNSNPNAAQPQNQNQNYPPPHNALNPSYMASSTALPAGAGAPGPPGRDTSRTPSPTPSEVEELTKKGVFDWQAMRNWRFWVRREWLCAYITLFLRVGAGGSCGGGRVLCDLQRHHDSRHPHLGVRQANCALLAADCAKNSQVRVCSSSCVFPRFGIGEGLSGDSETA